MSQEMTYEELLELLNKGRIGFLQFVANGPYKHDFINWCRDHGEDPTEDSAEFYCDMMDIVFQDTMAMSDDYGIWN